MSGDMFRLWNVAAFLEPWNWRQNKTLEGERAMADIPVNEICTSPCFLGETLKICRSAHEFLRGITACKKEGRNVLPQWMVKDQDLFIPAPGCLIV